MKTLFSFLAVVIATGMMAQVHEAGTILFNVDYEFGPGYSQSASVDGEDVPDSFFDDVTTSSGLVRVDAQFGVADAISAGIVGRFGSFTTKPDGSGDDVKTNVTEVGVEGRYHFVNTDQLAVFGALSGGISNQKADEIPSGADEDDFKRSGIFYGIAGGAHYLFTDNIGANLRVGFGGHNTNDDVDSFDSMGNATTVESKSGLAGLEVGVGVTVVL